MPATLGKDGERHRVNDTVAIIRENEHIKSVCTLLQPLPILILCSHRELCPLPNGPCPKHTRMEYVRMSHMQFLSQD